MSTTPTLRSASTTQDKSCYQAVRADGIPVCLFCSGPVEFADKLKCSDWDKRFCSHDCKKEYQVTMFSFVAHCYWEMEGLIKFLLEVKFVLSYLGMRARVKIKETPAI